MTLQVQLVPLSLIHQTWPLVDEYLEEALKWGGDDYTLEQIKVYITKGDWMLLVAVDEQQNIHGAAAVNVYNMPNDRVAFVVAIGGRLISSNETYAQLCALLKSFGATKIRGVARESIARLWKRYGFKERYILVEADL
jgi:hypothetical protein